MDDMNRWIAQGFSIGLVAGFVIGMMTAYFAF